MKDNFNIEELFREKLSGFEQDPPAEAWSAIQSGLGKGAASSGAATGASVLGWKGIALLSLVTVSGGIFLGTLFSDSKQKPSTPTRENVEVIESPSTEDKMATEENLENITGNTAVVLKDPENDDKKAKSSVTVVRFKEKELSDKKGSVVNNWMTHPDRKDQLMGGKVNEKNASPDRNESTKAEAVNGKTATSSTIELTSEEVSAEEPLALIQASLSGGPAPLTVDFSNAGNGDQAEWTFGDGQSYSGHKTQHTFTKPGVYNVTLVVSNKGKTSKDVIRIDVMESSSIKWVNVFTPNGDGHNDRFELESERIIQLTLQLYDREGNVLFSTSEVDFSWDGFLEDGTRLKPGVYFYRCFAKGEDGKTYKQTQTLKVF